MTTMTKLITVLSIFTIIYVMFSMPLITSAYNAVIHDNMNDWTNTLSNFLSFNVQKLF